MRILILCTAVSAALHLAPAFAVDAATAPAVKASSAGATPVKAATAADKECPELGDQRAGTGAVVDTGKVIVGSGGKVIPKPKCEAKVLKTPAAAK